jgi:lysophospholipase L1-like esterase
MRIVVAALTIALGLGAAVAGPQEPCEVPPYLLVGDSPLDRVAAAIKKDKQLDVAVLGTGSSLLTGANGQPAAYPERFQAALQGQFPNIAINVASRAKRGQTTFEMSKILDNLVADPTLDLVIWETGTVDAIRGVDPEEFHASLNSGVKTLLARGVNVILVNMQYSPRTHMIIARRVYDESMRAIAREYDVLLFDRFAIMRYWNDIGTFDLYAADRKSGLALRVHDCLGRALAALVVEAAHLEPADARPQ